MGEARWFRLKGLCDFVTPSTWWGRAITVALALFLIYHAASTGRIYVLVTAVLLAVAMVAVLRFARGK